MIHRNVLLGPTPIGLEELRIWQNLVEPLRHDAEPLGDPLPHPLPRHRRDEASTPVNVERTAVVALGVAVGKLAKHLAAPNQASGDEHVATPTVIGALAIVRERARKVRRGEHHDIVPRARHKHLGGEGGQSVVDVGQPVLSARRPTVRVETALLDEEGLPLGLAGPGALASGVDDLGHLLKLALDAGAAEGRLCRRRGEALAEVLGRLERGLHLARHRLPKDGARRVGQHLVEVGRDRRVPAEAVAARVIDSRRRHRPALEDEAVARDGIRLDLKRRVVVGEHAHDAAKHAAHRHALRVYVLSRLLLVRVGEEARREPQTARAVLVLVCDRVDQTADVCEQGE
mmetsp:Transcript_22472/g.70515  ORF Transcript_22472/g.70515 Transcript_22472/m.70515 type:complete len:344 (+) Transcript_22472:1308-2339(+)